MKKTQNTKQKNETHNVADQDGTWDGCTRAQERHIGFRAEGNSSYYGITRNITV